jgi:hypothetical protein
MVRMRSGRGGGGRFVHMQPDYYRAVRQAIGTCGTYPCSFLLNIPPADIYESIAACGTCLGNRDVTHLESNSYAQITTCGTYPGKSTLSPLRFAFPDKGGVALNVIGMFLPIASPVLGPGAICLLLA